MKKLTVLISVLLAVLFVLSSCGTGISFEKIQGEIVLQKINRKMGKLDSYEYDMEMQMKFKLMGMRAVGTASGHVIEDGIRSDDYYHDETAETKTSCVGLGLDQTVTTRLTYNDGKYFLLYEADDHSQKLWSPMTVSEFTEYQQATSSLPDSGKGYSRIQSVKNDDKTWTVTCSGFSDQTLAQFRRTAGLNEDEIGGRLTDLEITYSADASYRLTQLDIRCLFEKPSDGSGSDTASDSFLPELTMTYRYSKYNEAERRTDPPDPEDYTEADDIPILDRVEDKIRTYREAEEGSFVAEMNMSIRRGDTSLSSYKETDTVHYGVNDDGFFYSVEAKTGSTVYQLEYSNGLQTVKSDEKTETESQTDAEARQLITSLLDSLNYNAYYVSDVIRTGENGYRLNVDTIPESLGEQIVKQINGRYKSGTQTITVQLKDGNIVSLNSAISVQGSSYYGGNFTIAIGCTITFQ